MRTPEMIDKTILFCLFSLLMVACDLPPDEIIDGDNSVDTDTESESGTIDTASEDVDTDTESETESEAEPDDTSVQCFEAMMCLAMTPESSFECLSGLDEGDREAATALALCLLTDCTDGLDNLMGAASCLLVNCPEETINCIGFSMF